MGLSPGDILDGKYRITGLLGEGGMGAVYDGENVRIKRRVAIKVLHVAASADVVERFQREAQAAGTIGNDHILEVLDLGTLDSGENYMVMEFLDGETLGQRIARAGRMPPLALVPLFRQICQGLRAVHEKGITHRDLKPDNVFILREKAGQADFVKLIDFGISKFSPLGGEFSKTRTGAVMGTPYYMSPEQANGSRDVDSRSDLYAVGVMLYESLTGAVPFDGSTFNELMFKIVLAEPPPLRQLLPDLDPAFESIVQKAMAREPAHRFQYAAELDAALYDWATTSRGVTVPPAGPLQIPGVLGSRAQPAPPRSKAPVIAAAVGVFCFVVIAVVVGALALRGKGASDAAIPSATTHASSTLGDVPTATAAATTTTASAAIAAPAAPSASVAAPVSASTSTTAPATGKPVTGPARPVTGPRPPTGQPDFGY